MESPAASPDSQSSAPRDSLACVGAAWGSVTGISSPDRAVPTDPASTHGNALGRPPQSPAVTAPRGRPARNLHFPSPPAPRRCRRQRGAPGAPSPDSGSSPPSLRDTVTGREGRSSGTYAQLPVGAGALGRAVLRGPVGGCSGGRGVSWGRARRGGGGRLIAALARGRLESGSQSCARSLRPRRRWRRRGSRRRRRGGRG